MGDSPGVANRACGETPVHGVQVLAFRIDTRSLTNDQFQLFIDEKGCRADAEIFGFSAIFQLVLAAPVKDIL